jgi:excisionase family DNA binding protein
MGAVYDLVRPRDAEQPSIRELRKQLAARPEGKPAGAVLRAPDGMEIQLPESVFHVLRLVVEAMASGDAVSVVPVHAELTTQQAAELLNVSRPHFVKLLEGGEIKFRKVGSHRKVRLDDLLAYKDQRHREQEALLSKMANEGQETGLYDEDEDDAGG